MSTNSTAWRFPEHILPSTLSKISPSLSRKNPVWHALSHQKPFKFSTFNHIKPIYIRSTKLFDWSAALNGSRQTALVVQVTYQLGRSNRLLVLSFTNRIKTSLSDIVPSTVENIWPVCRPCRLKPCSHVPTPKFGPKFDPLKFYIVPMVTGRHSDNECRTHSSPNFGNSMLL